MYVNFPECHSPDDLILVTQKKQIQKSCFHGTTVFYGFSQLHPFGGLLYVLRVMVVYDHLRVAALPNQPNGMVM